MLFYDFRPALGMIHEASLVRYMCACTCVCERVCACACVRARVCVCVRARACARTRARVCVRETDISRWVYVYVRVCVWEAVILCIVGFCRRTDLSVHQYTCSV